MFLGVPRVWEKFEARIKDALGQATGVKKSIADWGLKLGYQKHYAERKGQSAPFCSGLSNKLFQKKLKTQLGMEQVKFAFFGAAPLP